MREKVEKNSILIFFVFLRSSRLFFITDDTPVFFFLPSSSFRIKASMFGSIVREQN